MCGTIINGHVEPTTRAGTSARVGRAPAGPRRRGRRDPRRPWRSSRSRCTGTGRVGATTTRSTSARRAASIDGNVGQVIADNHFNVDSAARPGFSPYVYPWSFPVLLAPFVRLWGLDLDRLKLVEVACWCVFLACWYGVLRRRMATWLAWATTAACRLVARVPAAHRLRSCRSCRTCSAVAATLWYADRIRAGAPSWDAVDRRQLIVARRGDDGRVQRPPRRVWRSCPRSSRCSSPTWRPGAASTGDWRAVAAPHVDVRRSRCWRCSSCCRARSRRSTTAPAWTRRGASCAGRSSARSSSSSASTASPAGRCSPSPPLRSSGSSSASAAHAADDVGICRDRASGRRRSPA